MNIYTKNSLEETEKILYPQNFCALLTMYMTTDIFPVGVGYCMCTRREKDALQWELLQYFDLEYPDFSIRRADHFPDQ